MTGFTALGAVSVAADVVGLTTGAASLIPQDGPSGIYYNLCTCQLDFLGTDSSAQDPQPQAASAATNGGGTNKRASGASPAGANKSGPIPAVPILKIKSSKGENGALWSVYAISAGNAVTATIRLTALDDADSFDMVYAVEFIAAEYKHGAIFDMKGFVEKPGGIGGLLSSAASTRAQRAYFAGRCLVVHRAGSVNVRTIQGDRMTITKSLVRLSEDSAKSGLQLTYFL